MKTCTVSRVPAHLGQATVVRCMAQDREGLSRLYADTFIAARVSIHSSVTEVLVCLRILLIQRISAAEAIDERRKSAFAICVGEKVECLESLGKTLLIEMSLRSGRLCQ